MDIRTDDLESTKGGTRLDPRQVIDNGYPGYFPPDNCECYRRLYYDKHKGAFLGFLGAAFILVTFAALLAGLTLAISSLDMTWLHVMSTTGSTKRRHQAKIVSSIKRRASWFLCSMVLVSVVCIETLPIIVQSLFGTGWMPVVVSTVAIALFSELLPQYLIPRQALQWSYYCWPFIWACMGLTAIVSWPLSFVLDKLTLPRDQESMYTSEQLAVLIKLHERQEKHGGHLGPDAGRVARGALDLDGRTLERPPFPAFYNKTITGHTADLEKADHITSDIVVPWSAVKFVRIDDLVNEEFVMKIKQFSYSRIPVIGNEDLFTAPPSNDRGGALNDQRIFGFLHIKALLGLDLLHSGSGLHVRDLPLYPLPIVRDDLSLYDLLNMFQLGISRMAVVILAPARDWTDNQATASLDKKYSTRDRVPLWSSTTGINARGSLDVRALGGRVDWITDFLNATRNNTSEANPSYTATGITCPAPLGIVTFEDILDTLLQKSSRDEKDFFERETFDLPTETRKQGDGSTVKSSRSMFNSRRAIPTHVKRLHVAFGGNDTGQGTLRRRNPSKTSGVKGGTHDVGVWGIDGTDDHSVSDHEALAADHSSYTENSDGGFHGPSSSADTELSTLAQRSISVNHKLRRQKGRSVTPSRTVSSPEEVTESAFQLGLGLIPRSYSCGFSTFVGGVQYFSRSEKNISETVIATGDNPAGASLYDSSQSNINASCHTDDTAGHETNDSVSVRDKRHTVPRLKTQNHIAIDGDMCPKTHLREEGFHDDRSLLPSQLKGYVNDINQDSTRRTSFWV